MKRFLIAICGSWFALAGIALAQQPPVRTVAVPSQRTSDVALPTVSAVPTQTVSPGEADMSREARAHEQYLLRTQAQEEYVHRAAVARAEQRTRRLESQRWFGISNTRPTAAVDPYDGDYSPGWVSNYPAYPFRWVGSGASWGWVEGQ